MRHFILQTIHLAYNICQSAAISEIRAKDIGAIMQTSKNNFEKGLDICLNRNYLCVRF
jgi:hypothetical protein